MTFFHQYPNLLFFKYLFIGKTIGFNQIATYNLTHPVFHSKTYPIMIWI